MEDEIKSCQLCKFGTSQYKKLIICRRFPKLTRKGIDNWCGEYIPAPPTEPILTFEEKLDLAYATAIKNITAAYDRMVREQFSIGKFLKELYTL